MLGNPKYCADNNQIDPERPRFWATTGVNYTAAATMRGYRWADQRPLYTTVATILPPNSEVCLVANHGGHGAVPPSSRHQGGAHVLMGDGAVVFITDSIEAGDQNNGQVGLGFTGNRVPGSQSPYGLGASWAHVPAKRPSKRNCKLTVILRAVFCCTKDSFSTTHAAAVDAAVALLIPST